MDIRFLFSRRSVTEVAEAAGVDSGTASKWKAGKQKPDWKRVCALYARGLITEADLRAGGLPIPLPASAVSAPAPAVEPAAPAPAAE